VIRARRRVGAVSAVVRAALLASVLVGARAGAALPARVASVNLCTDGMLLELAPAATLMVTRLAQDPQLAPFAARARGLATTRGHAEELVAFAPDLVLTSASSSDATTALLSRLGYRVEHFPVARSLEAFMTDLVRLGTLVGRADAARARVDRLRARLAALRIAAPASTDQALVLSANGYVPGPETLADDLLAHAGLANAAAAFGLPDGGFITLERLLRNPPRWLVVGTTGPGAPALAGEFLRHPALQRALPDPRHRVEVPESAWACGGEHFADAVTALVAARYGRPAPTP